LKTSITYWLALSCLLISSSIKGQQYSVAGADSLFRLGEFEKAATAFERVYFFSRNNEERISALLSRADCFKNLNRNYEAYNSLVRIHNYELSDSLKCAANYQLALNLYLSGYFNDAEKYCAKNNSIPVNTPEYKSSLLLHGLVLNELLNYKQARTKFSEYLQSGSVSDSAKDSLNNLIVQAYDPKNLPRIKSLKKARRLSKVLPGAGLFYAGKPGKAMANISFQLLAAGYTAANIYVGNYLTAGSAGFFLLRAFYTGGVNQLNEVIPKVNYLSSRKFNDTFKNSFIQKVNRDYEN
jgi:tetratricopeptide (TPR) repeat protein